MPLYIDLSLIFLSAEEASIRPILQSLDFSPFTYPIVVTSTLMDVVIYIQDNKNYHLNIAPS